MLTKNQFLLESKMKFKAIIFDMDGVLIDSEKIWAKYEGNFLKKFAPSFSSSDNQKIIGQSIEGIYNLMTKEFSEEMKNVDKAKFLSEYEKFGCENIYQKTSLTKGVKDFLEKYTTLDRLDDVVQSIQLPKFALASSAQKSWVNITLQIHNLAPYFQEIVCGNDVKKAKPAPDIFLLAAKKLNVRPEDCLVLEDSKNGAIAGKKAGMTVYGYRNGFNDEQDLSMTDQIFTDFNEIELI